MNSKNKSVRTRLILSIPSLIFLIIMCSSIFWISDLFVEMGLNAKDRSYINLVVVVTFLIGLLTGKLLAVLQSKYK
ncbi:hypothetical protein [Paenibacillus sp. L3-i20]|uniref:hypothetical protein n=1 Tax=Paenibacillus sp. L3-i20 TaxID=2905833 RepID=UPI001EDE4551|nr:hypothetical protein [Paenibacillus sp. L3-i20]GKU79635.1 hypothetical protein L3i20_v240320 [Paenibacillus sp. L3-i20]